MVRRGARRPTRHDGLPAQHARRRVRRRTRPDPGRRCPPFVALDFAQRTALVRRLTDPEHPEKQLWIGLALFSNMAYDSAAHLNTTDALAAGHPGLLAIGYATPDPDGLWRFPRFSYGRRLAPLHPNTTPTGSPA